MYIHRDIAYIERSRHFLPHPFLFISLRFINRGETPRFFVMNNKKLKFERDSNGSDFNKFLQLEGDTYRSFLLFFNRFTGRHVLTREMYHADRVVNAMIQIK